MQAKQQKICTFSQNEYRLQLIRLSKIEYAKNLDPYSSKLTIRYQVLLNRKVISTSISEYAMRKLFATYCQNIVLQLKIY